MKRLTSTTTMLVVVLAGLFCARLWLPSERGDNWVAMMWVTLILWVWSLFKADD